MRLYFFLLEKELTEADDETQGASTYTCPNRAAALTRPRPAHRLSCSCRAWIGGLARGVGIGIARLVD
jgi:predicted lipid-binding transport protein (Tim44 family)